MAGTVDARVGVAPSFGYVGLSKCPSKECQNNRHKKVCKSSRIDDGLAKIGVPSKPKVAPRLSTSHDVIARRLEPTTSDMILNNTHLHAGSDWCFDAGGTSVRCIRYGRRLLSLPQPPPLWTRNILLLSHPYNTCFPKYFGISRHLHSRIRNTSLGNNHLPLMHLMLNKNSWQRS